MSSFSFPLVSGGKVELISLQKGSGAEQLETIDFPIRRIGQLEGPNATFDDTAAALANLDAVVACDGIVAHLAGALGMPVLLALGAACDWRWMRGRSDSPWYPTTSLYRQDATGDWGLVFQQIAGSLNKVAASHRRTTRGCRRR